MTTEAEVVVPVLKALTHSPTGVLPTWALRKQVRASVLLTSDDLRTLLNRNDQKIDQTVRNLKSHRRSPGNPFFEGLLEDVPRGFKITDAGRKYLGS